MTCFPHFQNRGGPGGIDMNVRAAWAKGYAGQGVVVTILDDGLETDHPDLKPNYVSYFFLILIVHLATLTCVKIDLGIVHN